MMANEYSQLSSAEPEDSVHLHREAHITTGVYQPQLYGPRAAVVAIGWFPNGINAALEQQLLLNSTCTKTSSEKNSSRNTVIVIMPSVECKDASTSKHNAAYLRANCCRELGHVAVAHQE